MKNAQTGMCLDSMGHNYDNVEPLGLHPCRKEDVGGKQVTGFYMTEFKRALGGWRKPHFGYAKLRAHGYLEQCISLKIKI